MKNESFKKIVNLSYYQQFNYWFKYDFPLMSEEMFDFMDFDLLQIISVGTSIFNERN